MGRDLYAESQSVRELFEIASESSGIDTAKLLFEADESELKETKNTQLAITLMNLAVRRFFLDQQIESSGAAGFSLGEWSAYVDAGVLGEQDIFPIVLKRGELMAAAAAELGASSAMAAILGLETEAVERAVEGIEGVFPANYNSPEQTVISGSQEGVDRGGAACKEAGAKRVLPLKVSGPFHTPMMEKAREDFAEYFSSIELAEPRKTLYSNVTGAPIGDSRQLRLRALEQITSPVRWTAEERSIGEGGYDLLVECGPGKVLSGLWKKSGQNGSCHGTDKIEAIQELIEKIKET